MLRRAPCCQCTYCHCRKEHGRGGAVGSATGSRPCPAGNPGSTCRAEFFSSANPLPSATTRRPAVLRFPCPFPFSAPAHRFSPPATPPPRRQHAAGAQPASDGAVWDHLRRRRVRRGARGLHPGQSPFCAAPLTSLALAAGCASCTRSRTSRTAQASTSSSWTEWRLKAGTHKGGRGAAARLRAGVCA